MVDEDENKEDEKTQEDTPQEDTPKGGSKKLLIIGLVAGLMVGGGAAAGYFIMMPSPEAEIEHVEEVVVEEITPELPDYQYARLDRLQLPLFYKGRILNYSVMDVSLETIGVTDKMLVVKNILIIRDALLRYYSVNPVGRKDNPNIVDFDKLSTKILELANHEAHKDVVKRVVISENRSF